MDLPPEYVLHLLPLMAICGLAPPRSQSSPTLEKRPERSASIESTSAPKPIPILASIPYIDGQLGTAILKIIEQWRTMALWEPFASKDRQVPGASLEGMFRVIPVDRSFRLPPQKVKSSSEIGAELHSPLSPFIPESPLYPDGIMSTMWIRKHRDIVPAIFVSFYELKSDEKPYHVADEELARHLVELKKTYQERGVKLCAVLTGPWEYDQVAARLEYFKRNSTLDSKTGLFYLPPPRDEQSLVDFFRQLRQSQYPFAVEHFRLRFNKTKKRRPKIPPALPNQPPPLDSKGWSVRTNFKLAVFSEFKQELDIAIKHYETSLSELIDLFSSTAILAPRSKRWTEARILADSITYKLCKLYLYLGEHTRCIATFNMYNKRMSSLFNGEGLGIETAEYWRWLGRNHRIFAELLVISEAVVVGEKEIDEAVKAVTGDMIVNVDQVLHHPGYYYLVAADCTRNEHAKSQGKEALSKENGESKDMNSLMFENLSLAAEQFGRRGMRRTTAYVELARCKSRHLSGKDDVALELLQPVMLLYRSERWYELLEEALLLGLECARSLDDESSVLRYSLELLSDEFRVQEDNTFKPPALLSSSFQNPASEKKKTEITVSASEFVSFVQPSFTFQSKSTSAGSPVSFQLSLQLHARRNLPGVTFSSASLSFNEQIPEIVLTHSSSESKKLQKLQLNAPAGSANLSLEPGETKVMEFTYTPVAEALIEAMALTLSVETETQIFTIYFSFPELYQPSETLWRVESISCFEIDLIEDSSVPRILRLGNSRQLTVHPKPPKVGLTTNLHGPAYAGEELPILITLENGEDEPVNLIIQYTSPEETESPTNLFFWPDSQNNLMDIGKIEAGQQYQCKLLFKAPLQPGDCPLTLVVKYTLESDKMTEVSKMLTLDVPVIQPFHTDFGIAPLLSGKEDMPDLFGDAESALKVCQNWMLTSSITRLGSETLEVQSVIVMGEFSNADMMLSIHPVEDSNGELAVLDAAPYTIRKLLSLSRPEDSDTTLAQLRLIVTWRRNSDAETYEWNSISLPIPELTFFPFVPRILAGPPSKESSLIADVAPHTTVLDNPQYILTYTFENPTSLLLNIDVHVESSDACAFAGPKQVRLGLLPFSMHEIKLIIMPVLEGEWVKLPRLNALEEERKRPLEILRLKDNIKSEGPDLFLRTRSNETKQEK